MKQSDSIGTEGVSEATSSTFVPLRKKLKRKSTGQEDNFIRPYFNPHSNVAISLLQHQPQQYQSIPTSLSPQDAELLRLENGIQITEGGEGCESLIITDFAEVGLSESVLSQLQLTGIKKPTPVQMQAIPLALAGRDIIAHAETGSGKTLAYVLPLSMFLSSLSSQSASIQQPRRGPCALIVAPTRELVEQIYSEIVKYIPCYSTETSSSSNNNNTTTIPTIQRQQQQQQHIDPAATEYYYNNNYYQYQYNYYYNNYQQQQQQQQQCYQDYNYAATIAGGPYYYNYNYANHLQQQQQQRFRVLGAVGGVPIESQIATMRKGVDILVATPGRLIDLVMNKNATDLSSVSFMVIDEADRMLESVAMEEQMRKIIALCGDQQARQTMLFSATMPASLERIARSAVMNPVRILVGALGDIPHNIEQNVVFMHTYQKKKRLLETLRRTERPPVIVFCNTHQTVDWVVNLLREEQFHVAGLHGEKNQAYRFRVMREFREERLDVLVATDLGSRGLDISDVTHVIMYDMPDTIETYTHRVGRTGRAGKQGKVTAFLTLDCKIAKELKDLLKATKQPVPPELEDTKQFGGDIIRTEFGDRPKYLI